MRPSPEEEEALKIELGIGPEARFVVITYNAKLFNRALDGWAMLVCGPGKPIEDGDEIPSDPPYPLHISLASERPDGSRTVEILHDLSDPDEVTKFLSARRIIDGTFVAIVPYSMRLYQGSAPRVFAELRWHPALGFRKYIGGLEHPHKRPDVTRAESAFKYFNHLLATRGGGRRSGYRKGRRATATGVWRWYHRWEDAEGDPPTLKDLAAYLGVKSRTTVEERLEEIGQTWPPMRPKRRQKVI